MSDIVIRCGKCGGGEFETTAITPEPIIPALLAIAPSDPGMAAWETVCRSCGTVLSKMYDYGTIDLGLVRDEGLDRGDDFEVFA